MSIIRLQTNARMSQAVVHGDTIYLAGQVGRRGDDVATQTRTILENIDALLEEAGSDKRHILSVTIWLADMADFEVMNGVWDEWIADGPAPVRAAGGLRLALPEYRVEVIVIAARIQQKK